MTHRIHGGGGRSIARTGGGGGEDMGSLETCEEESNKEDGLKVDHSFWKNIF